MEESNFQKKLKQYLKIIFLGFFINAVPYFISGFRISLLHLGNGWLKTFLVLFSWIFVSGTVFMFGDDIKGYFDNIKLKTWAYVVLVFFLSIVYFSLLALNIIL